jgi:hypothetical protein
MKNAFAIACMLVAGLAWTSVAEAHGRARIARELRDDGYTQIEIEGRKAPYDILACRGTERFQFQIDFYGKRGEELHLGACSPISDSKVKAPVGTAAKASPQPAAQAAADKKKGAGCVRFVPAVGATIPVDCP